MENLQGELEQLKSKWESFFASLPAPYFPIDVKTLHIGWNERMRSRAGLCKPYERIIELNPHLLNNAMVLEEVLLHEICHVAIGVRWPRAQSHGEKWARLMKLCGLEPKRCHSLQPEKRRIQRRWELNCRCSVHRVTTVLYNRIRRGMKYRCLKCQATLQ